MIVGFSPDGINHLQPYWKRLPRYPEIVCPVSVEYIIHSTKATSWKGSLAIWSILCPQVSLLYTKYASARHKLLSFDPETNSHVAPCSAGANFPISFIFGAAASCYQRLENMMHTIIQDSKGVDSVKTMILKVHWCRISLLRSSIRPTKCFVQWLTRSIWAASFTQHPHLFLLMWL